MNITKTFSYDIPDEYLAQTAKLKKKATATYNGPDKMFVFVSKEDGLLHTSQSFVPTSGKPSEKESVDIRAGIDQVAVLLNPAENELDALIASFYIGIDTTPESGYPQKEYALEDGVVYYTRPDPTSPDHTYEVSQIKYDLENENWITPFPWKLPHINMEQHMSARDGILSATEFDLAENGNLYTEKMKDVLLQYIDELKNCYEKFKDIPAHMIPFPTDPKFGWTPDYDYNLDPDNLLDTKTKLPKLPTQE